MVNIHVFKSNLLEENCYLIWPNKGSKRCWIIDCGAMEASKLEEICQFIAKEGLVPVRHLITHGHFDHIFGAQALYERYGLCPDMTKDEVETYENASDLMKMLIPQFPVITLPPIGELFEDGEEILLTEAETEDIRFEVIATPGHTPGGCCYYCREAKILLSGDTLFRHSYGRTDFPGGSGQQLYRSLLRLMELPEDVQVLPGHGEATMIGEEKYLL